MGQDYNETYRQKDWFGARENHLLERYRSLVPGHCRVLDVGVGQGRNALPLARRRCQVTGIDTASVSVDQVNELAQSEKLPLTARLIDFEEFLPDEPFDVVLCFGLFQMLPPAQAASLVERLRSWTRSGGALFFIAWHVDDPGFERYCLNWERTGLRSFRSADGQDFRTFLGRREILQFFRGWQVVHHREGLGPVHRHGQGDEERHGDVEVVLTKP